MSTGYTIFIGYNHKGDKDEAWQALVDTIERIKHNPGRIIAEARRLNAPETCERGCCTLQSLAEIYQGQSDGAIAKITIDRHKRYAIQLASGDDRTLKEHVRRAFCRLVIEDMHRQGIEVNLQVT